MSIAFYLLSLIIIGSSIAVVALRNPIHSALNLIVAMLAIAGVFALLNAHFLSAVQIIVYAGAIVVLVLFVLMLLNIKVEMPKKKEKMLGLFAIFFGVLFLCIAVPLVQPVFENFSPHKIPLEGTVAAMGSILYTRYVFTFEAASVLIMVAIVGAVMLAKRSYRQLPEGKER